MNSQAYGDFIVNILSTLQKNGYPKNKVSLPLEKMYESAYERGLNFNKVLEFLEEKGTSHEKTTDKIIFFEKVSEPVVEENPQMPDMMGLMNQAQEMMRNMSPDQLKNLQNMYANMDDSQKEAIMKQAKDMGLF